MILCRDSAGDRSLNSSVSKEREITIETIDAIEEPNWSDDEEVADVKPEG